MAKRRKNNNLFGELAYRLSMLAGLVGFVGGIYLFDSPNSGQTMLYAAFLAVGAMISSTVLLLMLRSTFSPRPRGARTFEFEELPASKQRKATEFEHEVARLIQELTGKQTRVVGGSGDGGIDIEVYDEQRHLVGIVQCKYLQPNKTVYPSHIRDLNTVRHFHHVNIAYLVTTGHFSDDSYKLAKQLGVRLIDGKTLNTLQKKVSL